MVDGRLDLHEKLCTALGSRNVYYQPSASVTMKYPAIVYSMSNIASMYANNSPFVCSKVYKVTVIDKSPTSKIVDKIAELPQCMYNTHYIADNLYHDVFTISY